MRKQRRHFIGEKKGGGGGGRRPGQPRIQHSLVGAAAPLVALEMPPPLAAIAPPPLPSNAHATDKDLQMTCCVTAKADSLRDAQSLPAAFDKPHFGS